MLSSSNAVDGLSVDELLTLFGANSSGAPRISITYSISPAGVSRLVVNHNFDQGEAERAAAPNAPASLDAMNAAAHGSGSDPQSWNTAAFAITSDGAHDTPMNIASVELYL